jgi:hypothetical protein
MTSMLLFRTKNEKELKEIAEEMSGEVSEERFYEAYQAATSGEHGFLFIDLHKKKEQPSMFRKNFDEYLIF